MAWTNTQTAQEATGSGTSANVSFSAAVTSGNVVVGHAFCNNVSTSDTITSITDNGTPSNTYSKVNNVGITGTAGTWNTVVFWSNGRLTNGATTITVNNSASQGNLWITIDEFNPPSAGTVSLDGNNSNSSASTNNPNTGSFTTTVNGDLIYAGTFANAANTAGTGFTITSGSGTDFASEFQSQTSAGAITPAFTNAATNQWTANGLALKVVAAAAASGEAAGQIYRLQRGPGWRWRAPPKGWKRRNGILLKAA